MFESRQTSSLSSGGALCKMVSYQSSKHKTSRMNQKPQDKSAVKEEFVCESGKCEEHKKYRWKIGGKMATALAGFITGVIVATVILYPWLHFVSKLCLPVAKS